MPYNLTGILDNFPYIFTNKIGKMGRTNAIIWGTEFWSFLIDSVYEIMAASDQSRAFLKLLTGTVSGLLPIWTFGINTKRFFDRNPRLRDELWEIAAHELNGAIEDTIDAATTGSLTFGSIQRFSARDLLDPMKLTNSFVLTDVGEIRNKVQQVQDNVNTSIAKVTGGKFGLNFGLSPFFRRFAGLRGSAVPKAKPSFGSTRKIIVPSSRFSSKDVAPERLASSGGGFSEIQDFMAGIEPIRFIPADSPPKRFATEHVGRI